MFLSTAPAGCPLPQVAQSEEICLELHTKDVPDDTTVGFHVDFVWKSTTFDRMKTALGTFRDYQASMSGYLFHTILGHNVEQVSRRQRSPEMAPDYAAAVDGMLCAAPCCVQHHAGYNRVLLLTVKCIWIWSRS
jgi:hypothetical protein